MKKQKVNVEQISETKLQLSISNFILSFWKAVCHQLQLQGFAEELKVTACLKINYSRDQEIECV